MGWKKRRNGRMYYYRSVRTSAGVRSEYIGVGEIAELIADVAQLLALRADSVRRRFAKTNSVFMADEQDMNQWLRIVQRLVHVTLCGWGYHQHKREWRLARRKDETMETSTTTNEQTVSFDRVLELVKVKRLTSAQRSELEMGLKNHPSVVNNLGDLAVLLRRQMISSMTQQPGMEVVWNAKMQTLRKEMGYNEAMPPERLVIDTVVTCWLHLQAVEIGYMNFCQQGGLPIAVATWEGRLSAAQNRFARQVELLAKLRYWGSRIKQVNIAQNMIVSNR